MLASFGELLKIRPAKFVMLALITSSESDCKFDKSIVSRLCIPVKTPVSPLALNSMFMLEMFGKTISPAAAFAN